MSKYLTIVPNNKGKEMEKNYEEMYSKIKDMIRLISNSSDYYDEKYVKNTLNWDNYLPVSKT